MTIGTFGINIKIVVAIEAAELPRPNLTDPAVMSSLIKEGRTPILTGFRVEEDVLMTAERVGVLVLPDLKFSVSGIEAARIAAV